MLPYLLMLTATGTHYVESAMIKTYNKKHSNGGFMFISIVSLFSALFFLVKYLFFDNAKLDFTPEVIPYAILAGVMYASSSVLVFLAIKMGSLAVTNLILGYSTIVVCLYGIIFLGESSNWLTYVSIGIMVLALFLLKQPEKDKSKSSKKNSLLWFIFAMLGMLTSAGYSIITKAQQVKFNQTVDSEYILIAIGFSAIATFIVGVITGKKDAFKVFKTCVPYAGIAGLSNGVTNLLSLLINTMIAVSISSPTRSVMTKVLHFILGYFIFKERYTVRQIIGLVLVCGAVVLLNLAPIII
jgi:drug/metabolite transporter (DMT)-like permease